MAKAITARLKTAAPSRTRVGRPTAERAEEIDVKILDAASAQFLGIGYEATSMEAIAAGAGVSKGTLYARYPNKTALLRAVYERYSSELLRQHKRESVDPQATFPERLRSHAQRLLDSLNAKEVRAYRELVRRAGAPDAEIVEVFYEVGLSPALDDLTRELREGAKEMGLEPADPRRTAEFFVSALLGWHSIHGFAGLEVSHEDQDAYADQVVRIVLASASAW